MKDAGGLVRTQETFSKINLFPTEQRVTDYLYLSNPENVRYPFRIINAAGHVVQTISGPRGAELISVRDLPAKFYIVATPRDRVKMFKK